MTALVAVGLVLLGLVALDLGRRWERADYLRNGMGRGKR